LKVSDLHSIYWEASGNPEGKPVLVLHGGPGGGSQPSYRGFFDPSYYKIVQFDQRGAGSSEPHACLTDNTTWHSVNDCEEIRKMLKVEKWYIVFGGSWGATLSLVYAQAHPEKVERLVLRGVFMCRKSEIDFFYQEGTSWLFPDFHEELVSLLPEVERKDVLWNYWRRLTGDNEEVKLKFAKAWTKYEMATCKLFIDAESIAKIEVDKFALAFARIETHYFINNAFMKYDNQILKDACKIKDIPTEIVQGRYDVVCPCKSAYELHKSLNKSTLHMIPDAGHSASELGIIDALVRSTDKYKL